MSLRSMAVAGLSALALAASGCGGDSESEVEKFPASFEDRYGSPENEATWYRHVTGTRMGDDGIFTITTDLGPESGWSGEGEWSETGGVICRAAAELAGAVGELGDGIRGVALVGTDGVELGGCA